MTACFSEWLRLPGVKACNEVLHKSKTLLNTSRCEDTRVRLVLSNQFAERRCVFFEQVLRATVVIVDGRQSWVDSEVVIQR